MSWIKHHEKSERLASQAQTAAHENRRDEALKLYSLAADAEESAIADLDPSKTRPLGISVVSAASLRYKANSSGSPGQSRITGGNSTGSLLSPEIN